MNLPGASLVAGGLLIAAVGVAVAAGNPAAATVLGGVALILLPVTAHTERQRREHQADRRRFDALVRFVADALLIVRLDETVGYASPSTRSLLGVDPTGWPLERLTTFLHPDERQTTLDVLSGRVSTSSGLPVRTGLQLDLDGGPRHLEVTVLDLRDDPDVAGLVIAAREIPERAALEQELRQRSRRDPLTQLPNRADFHERLEAARERAVASRRPLAVFVCDLDDFRHVNENLGHVSGDQLLQEVSRRLTTAADGVDDVDSVDGVDGVGVVARLGGDEFGVLCENVGSARQASEVASALIGALHAPITVAGQSIQMGMSIGLTVDAGDRSADELLRDADIAMYEAKSRGKNTWTLHRAVMTTRARARFELAADLRDALHQRAIDADYQPIVDLASGDIVGVEALARWTHPRRGPVSPAEFIALAEQTGSIVPLGEAVLDRALSTVRQWQMERPDRPPLGLSINVSARQLVDESLINGVTRALARHGGTADRLLLELTETAVLEDLPRAAAVMHRLRRLGVRFAIDDFGTGYSSLTYVQQLPVDVVKIDRSFVAALGRDPRADDLVRTMLGLADSLGLDVIAEGIETEEQLALLRRLGCAFGQGFLLGRPAPLIDLGGRRHLGRDRVTALPRVVSA